MGRHHRTYSNRVGFLNQQAGYDEDFVVLRRLPYTAPDLEVPGEVWTILDVMESLSDITIGQCECLDLSGL
jgi:hypothetical protein